MAGHIQTAKRQDWCTPKEIVEVVRTIFNGKIDLDPCSNSQSIVGAKEEWVLTNGLTIPWGPRNVFANPPYGRGLDKWVAKASSEAGVHDAEVIMLLPAAVDTGRWQHVIFPTAQAVCWIKGRVKFIGAAQGAPFASALVYWGQHTEMFSTASSLGRVFAL